MKLFNIAKYSELHSIRFYSTKFIRIFNVEWRSIICDGKRCINNFSTSYIYKITFSTASFNWGRQISCSSDCSPSFAESLQNSDSSKIYSLFLLESSPYAYFITLNATDGSAVDSRYKSTISWDYLIGSVKNGNNLIFNAFCASNPYMYVYDTSSFKFSVNKWRSALYGMTIEPSTNR